MRALRAGSLIAATVTTVAIVSMVAGLMLSARPEVGTVFGMVLAPRDGLALALASGAVAIAFAILGRVLGLLSDNLADDGVS